MRKYLGTLLSWAAILIGLLARGENRAQSAERDGLLLAARTAEAKQDLADALSAYASVLRLNADDVEALMLRGTLYAKMKRRAAAVADFRRGLELDPQHAGCRRALEDLLLRPVDMRTWRREGPASNGKWSVADDGKSVLQSVNLNPTFFVGPEVLRAGKIEGTFRVETTTDDDYIGFVFGYQSPLVELKHAPQQYDFLVFDWKQATQSPANEGFSLLRVKGMFDYPDPPTGGDDIPGLWDHKETPSVEILATDYGDGKGWKDETEHRFELDYQPDRLIIAVDGRQIFDVKGNFPPGRFGFYNYSQESVRYWGFTRRDVVDSVSLLKVMRARDDAEAGPSAIELILDSSQSMEELVNGRPKNEIAREVLQKLLKELPESSHVGLRLYGHWGPWVARRGDPGAALVEWGDPRLNTDSQLVVPIALLDGGQRKKMFDWMDWAKPRGKTPMVHSLLEASKDFPASLRGPKTVVLVSDGVETCGGKINDVKAAYGDGGIAMTVHVVGFDIRESSVQKQLEQLAAFGGGKYFSAMDANQLAGALRSAVVSKFEVWDETGKTLLARGAVDGDPVDLPAGNYQIRDSLGRARPIKCSLPGGKTTDVTLDKSGEFILR